MRHSEPIGAAHVTGAAAMFAADTASRAAGIELVRAGGGTAEVRMTVRSDMVNGHGIAHGGYVFLLADTAFACACNEPGSVTVAVGADITFLAPARVGDSLTAVASVRSRRGRSGIYDVTVTSTAAPATRAGTTTRAPTGAGSATRPGTSTHPGIEGEIIAEFRGRSRTLPPPPEEGTAT